MQGISGTYSVPVADETTKSPTDVLILSNSGAWTLNLPKELHQHQVEIENLLGRVFAGKQSHENFMLAKQMTMNWCLSKYRTMGLNPDDTEWL
jgi:hypothetical protein